MSGFLCSMVGASFTVAAVAEVLRSKKGVTAVGNAQVDTAQSKFGGASALFDGTGDYLTVGNTVDADMALTGNNWTVEYWARINAHAGQFQCTIGIWDSVSPAGSVWYVTTNAYNSTNKMGISYVYGTNSLSGDLSFGSALSTGVWQHHAFVRNGNTLTAYLDGVSQGTHDMTGRTIDITGYNSSSNTTLKLTVGAMTGASGAFNGHLDEIRISNSARYTANFTAPTAAFVNDANTVLLIHANGTDASTFFEDDNGVRASRSIVASGGAQVSTTQSKFGGTSLSLDGTGDYLNVGETGDFAFGTGNFTIEAFIRNTKASSTRKSGIFSKRNFDNINSGGWGLYLTTDDGKIGWEQLFSGGTAYEISTTIAANTWYHVAVVRNGSAMNIYIDGTSRASWTDSTNYTNVNQLKIGTFWDSTQGNTPTDSVAWQGFIDEMRVSDTARYTSNFTAPTQPFVNDSNTLLLIHADGTNASTVFRDDNGAVPFSTRTAKTFTVFNQAQIDTAQYKYGSSSYLGDGTGDYIVSSTSNDFSFTGDFTVELWVRLASTGAIRVPIGNRNSGTGLGIWWVEIGTDQAGYSAWQNTAGTSYYPAYSGTISANTWTHLAVVRNGSTLTMYKDGVGGTAVTSVTGTFGSTGQGIYVGGIAASYNWNGHIDEVRISNTARYTANFTAPTAPFQNDPNTLLLLHMEGADASTTFTDDVFGVRTQIGIAAATNAVISTAQSKFGGSSFFNSLSGTWGYLETKSNLAALELGTGNFTVEGWFRFDNTNTDAALFSEGTTTGDLDIRRTNDNLLRIGRINTAWDVISGATGITANTWHHIAYVRNSTTLTIYVDGVSKGSGSNSINYNLTNQLRIGAQSTSSLGFAGYMDELRISNTARYTAGFTAPTAPFQNDANTLLLLHCDGTNNSTVFFDDNGIAPYTP